MSSDLPTPGPAAERLMKLTLALWGGVCIVDAVQLGTAVGRGKGIVPALTLTFVGLLAMTALQFRAVTAPNRPSTFVRIWAAWQHSSIILFLYLPLLANQFVEGPPRTEFDIVLRYALDGLGGMSIAFALANLFLLLRPNPPLWLRGHSQR